MDYIAAVKPSERDWIENNSTLPLFRLACKEAYKNDILGTKGFRRLLTYIPDWKYRNDDRPDEHVVERFEDCFGKSHSEVVTKAEVILETTDHYCNGRFGGWALTANGIPNKVVKDIMAALFSSNSLKEVEKLILRYGGKVPGLKVYGFSELCYMLREDVFPALNRACFVGKGLLKAYSISPDSYENYPLISKDLGMFMSELGFPPQHKFAYFDRYTYVFSEKVVRKNAHESFHTELNKFIEASIVTGSGSRRRKKSLSTCKFGEEGDEILKTHKVKERNPKNRNLFLSSRKNPDICEICGYVPKNEYGFSKIEKPGFMIEVHHVQLLKQIHTPSSDDLMGLCPNCHTAIHKHITEYLRMKNRRNFVDAGEAVSVHERFIDRCHELWGCQ